MTTTIKHSPKMESFLRWLKLHGACGLTVGCGEGMDLVRRYATPAEWWSASERGDDMLWLAGRVEIRRQDLVLAACACARLALPHVKKGEQRPLAAIEMAERWARGEEGVTLTMVRAAASAAHAASAAYAADAAAYDAAYDAAHAAADAAYYAAHAAAYAAYDANAARSATLKACADLVRAQIPWSMIEQAMTGASPSPTGKEEGT